VEQIVMSPVGTRLRVKIAAVLVTLVALWGYAAFLTARDAVDLLQVRTLSETLGQPTDSLILGLQAERRLTMTMLARPAQPRAALAAQRARTDEAVAALRRFAQGSDVRLAATEVVQKHAAAMAAHLDALGPLREAVDAGRLDRRQAAASYAEIIDAGFTVYGSQWTSRETGLIEDTRALVALARAREVLSREDALVAGALTAGQWTGADRTQLIELVATGRFVRAEASAGLPAAERGRYEELTSGPSNARLGELEQSLIDHNASAMPPVKPQAWQSAVEPILAGLREVVASGVRDSVARATPSAVGVIVRTGLVGGLGLVAVVGAILISITTTRNLARRLRRLRATAEELAEADLPDLAARLRQGEPLEAPAAAPTPTRGADPIGEAGRAIEAARRTAVRAVAAEAEAHRGTRDLFLEVTRRNQILLRRQLTLLEAMERRETDAEQLAELFRVDHLTTRIRRNVEKLITMAGATPARRWRRPVPLVDVVRGAVAEVDDYPRVLAAPDWAGALAGTALPDVVHLLAELIENALSFSPPATTVRVSGERWAGGQAIVVNDDGPGLSLEELAAANELVGNPPAARPAGGRRGLYVVGQLARRHGVAVELRTAPRGGTMAAVLIPAGLIVDAGTAGASGERHAPPAGQPQVNRAAPPAGYPQPAPAPPAGHPQRALAPPAGYPQPAPAPATDWSDGRTAVPATPAGLPMRRRRSNLDAPGRESRPTEPPAPAGYRPDGSETVEIPLTRPAPDQPAPPAYARGASEPARLDDGFNSSERTTSDFSHSHDR
jgi:hypothetical protein